MSRLSVRLPKWNNSAPTGLILMKFVIRVFFFFKSVEKTQVLFKSDKNNGYFTRRRVYFYTWADHLIPGLIFFFREIIIRSEMATEWGTWQTSVCAKPEVGISPHSLCGGPWVNVYNSVRRISRWRRKCSSACALISVSFWGKLVLKRTKRCKQLSERPA